MPGKDSSPKKGVLAPETLPSLTDLLVGFQKAMARTSQLTANAMIEDPLYLYGRRNLYQIEGIDVELPIRVRTGPDIDRGHNFPRCIQVITPDAETREPPESWGRLRFSVKGKTVPEQLDEAKVFIIHREFNWRKARNQKAGQEPEYVLQFLALDARGEPLKFAVFKVTVQALQKGEERVFELLADERGTCWLSITIGDKARLRKVTGRREDIGILVADQIYKVTALAVANDQKVDCYRGFVIDRQAYEQIGG